MTILQKVAIGAEQTSSWRKRIEEGQLRRPDGHNGRDLSVHIANAGVMVYAPASRAAVLPEVELQSSDLDTCVRFAAAMPGKVSSRKGKSKADPELCIACTLCSEDHYYTLRGLSAR